MTAKEYLSRLRNLDLMIRHKQVELDELKIMATSIGSPSGQQDEPVSHSSNGDALERKVIKYIDLDAEITNDIDNLINIRHIIINEIHQLSDARYIEILFKRYVEYKKFEQISVDMGYDYDWTRRLHIDALEEFQQTILSTTHTNTQTDVIL